jgi:hypothetical protein
MPEPVLLTKNPIGGFCADVGAVRAAQVVMMASVRIFRIEAPSCPAHQY